MTAFVMTLALLLTIGLCLVVGVVCGYLLIVGILNAFNPHKTHKPTGTAAVASAGPSGD